MRIQWPICVNSPIIFPIKHVLSTQKIVSEILHAIFTKQMLCSLKHLLLVWLHKGEPKSQPLTHYIMALKMQVKWMFSHTAYSKPEDFRGGLCIWFLLDRTACTRDWSLKMLIHTHKLHFPFTPGRFSLLRDTRYQKLTQESQLGGLPVTHQCPLWAAQPWANLQLSISISFYFSIFSSPPGSAFTARSPQQRFPLAGGTVRSTAESCSQLGPHRSTVIIIITDENPFTIFLNYRSGIQCPAHIPE